MKTIVIDAGHAGKYNRSTVNKSYYESDMNWKLHLLLKEELEKYMNVKVITTRKSQNEDKSLYNRGYYKGADLFLSIHSNAAASKTVDYVVVYRGYGEDKSDAFALDMAKAIHKEMNSKQNPRTNTRKSLVNNNDYYGVLRGAGAAGIKNRFIIEHGFHTNLANTNFLLEDSNLKKLAIAEAEVIAKYMNLIKKSESKQATQTPINTAKEEVHKTDIKPDNTSYLVKITADTLNVRKGPSTSYKVVTTVKENQVYTIVAEEKGWGKLKSGAGWISLKYTKRV